MPQQAHVTSTDAIDGFRADLITYVSKAKAALENTFDEISRLRDWVERDRRSYWEQQVRRRTKILSDAQQALFSARLLNLRSPTIAEQTAVNTARRALAEAEGKLATVKKWARELDNQVQPLLKELEHVRTLLSRDAPSAVAHLVQLIRRLDEYQRSSGSAGGSPVAADANAAAPANGNTDTTVHSYSTGE
jgi:chromosome segregation ATPase